jgi:nitroreductase
VELWEALRRRKMVRSFDQSRAVPPESLDRVLSSVLHAPSAGFTQGNEYLVLDEPSAAAEFWALIEDPAEPATDEERALQAPVIVLPLSNREAYTSRYSEGDKARHGLQEAEAWPVPFWDTDAAMASMCMLLAAVDEGLGAFFFGIGHGEDAVRARFGIPAQLRPVGVVALGYAAPADPLSAASSGRTRRRRPVEELVHRNGW